MEAHHDLKSEHVWSWTKPPEGDQMLSGSSGETQERSCKNTQNANGYSPGIRIRVKEIEQRTLTYCI